MGIGNGESLKAGIFKIGNLQIFRAKGHCLLSWTNVSFINHSKPNIPAIPFQDIFLNLRKPIL